MTDDLSRIVKLKLRRSEETLESAALLLEAGYRRVAVGRMYYACFYVVSALLYQRGLGSSKHSGVRALFNRYFVKANKVPKDVGVFYGTIFDYRQDADYLDTYEPDNASATYLLQRSREFIDVIRSLIPIDPDDSSS